MVVEIKLAVLLLLGGWLYLAGMVTMLVILARVVRH